MTFAPGQLPPVNAFWSITMYDGRTQLLIDNPINRYLVNSPMLPELKKNPDGSLTLFIQRDSPGKDKESNWLPAPDGPMFVVMRLYWPKDEAPSVYPLGKGAWKPPAIVPVRNLNALAVTRFGDKSLENIVRTDERYGHDGVFQGPRGWAYWNHLEYPKPIQNPNLWPDTQSTYFLGRLELPAGSVMTMDFTLPARPLLPVRALPLGTQHLRRRRRDRRARDRARARVHQPLPCRRQPTRRAARLQAQDRCR